MSRVMNATTRWELVVIALAEAHVGVGMRPVAAIERAREMVERMKADGIDPPRPRNLLD